MKEKYEELQSEVIAFENTDIIVTSGDEGGDLWTPRNSNAS